MIEQIANKLVLTFPTPDSATTFANFLQSLVTITASPQQPSLPAPGTFGLPFEPSQEIRPVQAPDPTETPAFLAPARSRHTVLTPERQDQIFLQRASGQTAHDRLLRAQTTLRDGVLPFSRPGQVPQPSGQPSPRIRAQTEGGFADGSGAEPEAERRKGRRLRPARPKL